MPKSERNWSPRSSMRVGVMHVAVGAALTLFFLAMRPDHWLWAIGVIPLFIGIGLDFGFTNDPTAILEVYQLSGELFINELTYETRLTNSDIDKRLQDIGINKYKDIIADSAEPKSIADLTNYGWNVYPAIKGADSVRNSIDILKRYKLNVTQRSVNLKKELNGYKWKQTKGGEMLNEPVDLMNHAIDALRYV
ncbi:MAG: hypothetical protein EBX72_00655, partial [Betaproteobacteria bacterium]|nr:hypothetical protein [Betaproteobacteria bacterium]